MADITKRIAGIIAAEINAKPDQALAAIGLLSMGFAVVLVITPGAGVLVITWLVGWYAVVLGLALLVLAWEVRRELTGAAPRSSARPGTPHPAT